MKRIAQFENRYSITKDGRVWSHKRNHYMNPHIGSRGYYQVVLTNDEKKTFCFPIHRLVANAYLAPVEGKEFVNHIDGNKLSNNVDNLEWCTHAENIHHARDVLGAFWGKRNGRYTHGKFVQRRVTC